MKSLVKSIQTAALKILIVENHVTDLKLMHSILARTGHEVTDVSSVEQAIEMLKTEKPHVILTDF